MTVPCTQCAASVQIAEGARFATCGYCGSALYIDKSKVVFHFVVTPTITMEEAQGKLKRWMAGNETVKGLDVEAQVTHEEQVFFPMWRFVVAQPDGDREFSELACSFAIPEIKSIPLSGGSLKYYAPKDFEGLALRDPEVLLDSALNWLDMRGASRDGVKETNLIHIPFYFFKYQYRGQIYQTVVDGVSGRVLASIYPAKTELPFVGIAVAAAITFFIAGLIAPSVFWRLLVYIILIVPFAVGSYVVVRKF
ncbi:MAG TPA: hypothetical protein VLR94_01010 [Acidobacteriota bacterium]|nr:hypothetical protein [Acidobacteriota bacterium]